MGGPDCHCEVPRLNQERGKIPNVKPNLSKIKDGGHSGEDGEVIQEQGECAEPFSLKS